MNPRLPPLLAALFLVGLSPLSAAPEPSETTGVVKVRVTSQAHDFLRPWLKKAPATREAVGAVLSGNRVLVTAELVANHNFVEIEHPDSGEKSAAIVRAVDYDANIALVEPSGKSFLPRIRALALADEPGTGDTVQAVQFESTGSPMRTPLTLTTVEVGPYPVSDMALLLYRLSGSLQYRDGSFALPLLSEGKLVGIVMRYDPRTQAADAISSPVIRKFLAGVARNATGIFPRAGVAYAPTRDPQLRKFLGLENGAGGVLVTFIDPRGPAAEAGIEKGDVLVDIQGERIDQDGNFAHPRHGRISLSHLISTADEKEMPFRLLRNGESKIVSVKPRPRPPTESISPPHQLDSAPRYLVSGGLVFQELGRQFLREWGASWDKRAPQRLLYLDRFQHELYPEGNRRIVFLSHVLPSPATIGYEHLSQLVVTRVNGRDIRSLEDLDAALAAPVDGFQKFELDGEPHQIVLDQAEAEKVTPALQRHYGVTELKRL